MKMKMKQKGFTLVEIAIVVAVGALLLVGISQAPRIIAMNKANADIAELPQIVTGIQKIYANQSTYNGASMATVIGLNGLPQDRVVAGTPPSASNRWGGAITLAAASQLTADDSIDLTYSGVPSLECTNIIPSVENRFRSVTVAGTAVKPAGGTLNLNDVASSCASSDSVTIVYRFAK